MKNQSPKKPQFRVAMRDFTDGRCGTKFDSLNEFQKSQWMTRFYVHEILRITMPGAIPDEDEDLDACFSDGTADSAVDFLARQQGHVTILQSKYHRVKKDEDERNFSHFCEVLERLHPKTRSGYKVSTRVLELAGDIDWDNDTFELQFLTLGKVNENMRAREKAGLMSSALADLQDRVEVTLLDETDLNEAFRDATTAGQAIPQPVDLSLVKDEAGEPWLHCKNTEGRSCFIGYIRAGQLKELNRWRYKLFALNIRNFVGDTKTNKGIINTALTEPDNFFFFNNGISAVATKIVPDKRRGVLTCERFSIINGAQTVRSLVKAHSRNASAVGNAIVLVRITEVEMRPSAEERAFLEEVTRFNNTQNAIKSADFRSNDPIQYDLVRDFARLYRDGRQYWYKNKRDATRDQRKIIINMEEFAKTVYAFQFGPADFFGGTDHLFDLGKDGGYTKLFGDGKEVWPTLPMEEFERLAGIWFLCEYVRSQHERIKGELLKDTEVEKEKTIIRQALERRWMIFFAVGEFLRARYRKGERDLGSELRKLSDPKRFDPEKGSPAKELSRYASAGCEMLVKLYRNAEKSPGFMPRNWFRSKETHADLLNEIRYSTSLVETLPLLAGERPAVLSED